jgi:hypothetical protein
VLVLNEVIEGGEAPEPSASTLLVAALLELVVQRGPVVDPDRPRLELLGDAQRLVDVATLDARGEPVVAVIARSIASSSSSNTSIASTGPNTSCWTMSSLVSFTSSA